MGTIADLAGIKEQLRLIFEAANTTTSASIDLSNGLAKSVRVKKILKLNPDKIPLQISFYPLVTCWIEGKDVISADIAKDQLNSRRRAKINLSIAGAVWNDNFKVDTEDPADEDINVLMENVEYVLRSNPNLNGKVLWQIPTGTQYYTSHIDEQTHLRVGILSLQTEIFY